MFNNKKGGSTAMIIFIGLLLFQLGMYTFIYFANQDANFSSVGSATSGSVDFSNTSADQDISYSSSSSFLDGFKISVFGLPSWFNFLYVTILAGLTGLSLYGLIRGL